MKHGKLVVPSVEFEVLHLKQLENSIKLGEHYQIYPCT